jgi:prepilin-type N-terminal cleavage/methylation domain-containing protein
MNMITLLDTIGKTMKRKTESGFTLIEALVVVVITGIMSAIAAPSWISFVNNQRMREANGKAYQAINDAKSKAKKDKINYTVQFRMNGNTPEYAVYSGATAFYWDKLGDQVTVTPVAIPINYKGVVPPTSVGAVVNIRVTNGNSKRCTTVATLLGALRQGVDAQCP